MVLTWASAPIQTPPPPQQIVLNYTQLSLPKTDESTLDAAFVLSGIHRRGNEGCPPPPTSSPPLPHPLSSSLHPVLRIKSKLCCVSRCVITMFSSSFTFKQMLAGEEPFHVFIFYSVCLEGLKTTPVSGVGGAGGVGGR